MEFTGNWMELLTGPRKTDGTCGLSFVNVSFKSSDMCAMFGIPIEIKKLVTDSDGWALKERESTMASTGDIMKQEELCAV